MMAVILTVDSVTVPKLLLFSSGLKNPQTAALTRAAFLPWPASFRVNSYGVSAGGEGGCNFPHRVTEVTSANDG